MALEHAVPAEAAAADLPPVDDRNLERALVQRLRREQPVAILTHVLLATAVVVFLWRAAPRPQLLGWAVALFLAIVARAAALWHWERAALPPAAVLRRTRWLMAAAGLAWGFGAAMLAPELLARWWALLLVVLSGLVSGAAASVDADPVSFRLFVAGAVGPMPFGILADGHAPENVFAVFLIVFFAVFVVMLNYRLHRALVRSLRDHEALGAARDIAERAVRTQADFLSNMSHEIRTPMNAILGLSTLALDTELTPEQRRQIGLVHGAAEGLLSVLNDILDFSKIEGEHLDLERIAFDLPALVETLVGLMGGKAREQGLLLRGEVSADVPRVVRGDPGRLRQVLTNFVGNALKFTAAGEVTVRVTALRRTEREAILAFAVRDTGIGIPADKLDTIFDAFSQADASTTRRYGGTGLGLAISQRLVRLMGGVIEVESELEHGSEFRFAVPFEVVAGEPERDVRAPAGASRHAIAAAPRPLRLLLAEDNPVNQEVAVTMLRRRGHHVDVVDNGRAAVAAATRTRYDAVLMDIQMPELDGIAATRAIRALPEGTALRIVALTAHTSGAERERCLAAGMSGYLTKPFKPQDLFAVVEAGGAPVAPVDLAAFRATMREAGAEDAVDGIVALFVESAPQRLDALAAALERGDAGAIERAAHAFRSAAATIGARGLAEQLAVLEQAGREGAPEGVARELPALRDEVAAVLTQLEGDPGRAHPHR